MNLLNQSPEAVTLEGVQVASSDGKKWQFQNRGETPKTVASHARAQIRFTVNAAQRTDRVAVEVGSL